MFFLFRPDNCVQLLCSRWNSAGATVQRERFNDFMKSKSLEGESVANFHTG